MAKKKPQSASASTTLTAQTRICVLYGQEPAIQKQRLNVLKDALTDAHGEFEIYQLDGKTASLSDVFDELRSFSLMQTYKLVLVDEGDQFVKNHRPALERYAQAPVDHATLVLRSTNWNKGKLDKLITGSGGAIIKCDPLKPHEAEAWLIDQAKTIHRCVIRRPASQILVERVGSDLGRLDSELSKLAVMAGIDQEVTADMIEQTVGRGSDAQAWLAQETVLKAFAQGRPVDAIAVIRELIELSGQPDILVMYFITDLVRKLSVAQVMLDAGQREADVATAVKMHFGNRKRLFFDALRKLSQPQPTTATTTPTTTATTASRASQQAGPKALERALDLFTQALEADRRSKSGLGSAKANAERFVVSMHHS